MLGGVVANGTGKAAAVGDEFIFGKTGTTENYGDAWFVGSNKDLTVAVWIGYPDRLQPMKTEFLGGPVSGGTFPAEIFHDFMTSWLTLRADREARKPGGEDSSETSTIPAQPYTPSDSAPVQQDTAPAPDADAPTGEGGTQAPTPKEQTPPTQQTPAPTPAPEQTPPTPAPEQTPAPAPTQPQTPAPSGGTGGGANAGAVP
jgi:penicillin-binding protein 1A